MRRVVVVLLAAAVVAGAGVATARSVPALSAHGPTSVSGTEASAVFQVGGRLVRQVRYDDRGTLAYRFVVANDGPLPVTVTGLAPPEVQPRLFRYLGVTASPGASPGAPMFTIGAGERTEVEVRLLMRGCETLSARAGSFATGVRLRTERAGMLEDTVRLTFPEQVHTGSPREVSCPGATATSRPPG